MLRQPDSDSAMAEPGLDVATSPQSDKEIENPELAESQAKVDRVLQSDVRLSTLPRSAGCCLLIGILTSITRSES